MRMEEWGVPDFYELVLITSEKTLAERPDVVQRLVRALMKGYADAAADPDAAVDTLLAGTDAEVDEAIERPGVQVIAPLWTDGGPAGWQTSEKWTNFADWMYTNKLVDKPIDGNAAFTNKFVEGAQK